MSSSRALKVAAKSSGTPLTPQQKRFNTLTRQIEKARERLAEWKRHLDLYRQVHAQELAPQQAQLDTHHRQWLIALDALLTQRKWTAAEGKTLRTLVCEGAQAFLTEVDDEDEQIKAIHDRHADVDFDTGEQESLQFMKEMAEAMTGFDLGDSASVDSMEDLIGRLHDGFAQQQQAQEQAPPRKTKTRRPSAAEQKRALQEQQSTQSIREVYRKLASELHPDRESDPVQREVKNALMQKVNQAYAAKDLLGLLALQLEIEQIDADHIANISAERLTHFNAVLTAQLKEIQGEINHIEMGFRYEHELPPGIALNPKLMGQLLQEDKEELRESLEKITQEIALFEGELAPLKQWLKQERQRIREEENFDRMLERDLGFF